MFQRAIRGAITVDNDTENDIREAVITLIATIKERNKYNDEDISHVIFTLTDDLKSVYPAKIARETFESWKYVPMMCFNEMKIDNSLTKCLRVMIVVNTELAQTDIKHVYLKGAEKLRKDLK